MVLLDVVDHVPPRRGAAGVAEAGDHGVEAAAPGGSTEGGLNVAAIQVRFRVQAHRYRSGRQRYEAARKPTSSYEFDRATSQCAAQTPAFEPWLQAAPERRQSSFLMY